MTVRDPRHTTEHYHAAIIADQAASADRSEAPGVEAIARLLWERFASNNDGAWPTAMAGVYRSLAVEVMALCVRHTEERIRRHERDWLFGEAWLQGDISARSLLRYHGAMLPADRAAKRTEDAR